MVSRLLCDTYTSIISCISFGQMTLSVLRLRGIVSLRFECSDIKVDMSSEAVSEKLNDEIGSESLRLLSDFHDTFVIMLNITARSTLKNAARLRAISAQPTIAKRTIITLKDHKVWLVGLHFALDTL